MVQAQKGLNLNSESVPSRYVVVAEEKGCIARNVVFFSGIIQTSAS